MRHVSGGVGISSEASRCSGTGDGHLCRRSLAPTDAVSLQLTWCILHWPTAGLWVKRIFQHYTGTTCTRWCSQLESVLAYWGFGLYWGKAVSQNAKGHILGHVKVGLHLRKLRNQFCEVEVVES